MDLDLTLPHLLCSVRLACWPRKLQRDLRRSKRLSQFYNFNWLFDCFLFFFCTKQLLVVCWKNWPQTTVITCQRLLGERNNYSRNRWDLRSLRFLHSKIIWSRWRLSWLWYEPRYEHNQNNTYNSHSLKCLIFEFRKTGLSSSDWSTDRHRSKMRFEFLFLYDGAFLGLASCNIFYWL